MNTHTHTYILSAQGSDRPPRQLHRQAHPWSLATLASCPSVPGLDAPGLSFPSEGEGSAVQMYQGG